MRIVFYALGTAASGVVALFASGQDRVDPRPGYWTHEVELTKFETSGIPADRLAEVKAAFLGKHADAGEGTCLSAEEARRAFAPERFKVEGFGAEQCDFLRADAAGARVDLVGTCRSDLVQRDFKVTGDKSPDKIDLVIEYDDRAPAEGVRIQSEIRIAARWTEACAPSTAGFAPASPGPSEVAAAGDAAMEAANAAAEATPDPPAPGEPTATAAPMVDLSGY